jgi:hypothetical protein
MTDAGGRLNVTTPIVLLTVARIESQIRSARLAKAIFDDQAQVNASGT